MIAFLALLIPTGKAFMSNGYSNTSGSLGEIPVPPLHGRKSERIPNAYFTKPETSFQTWLKRGKSFLARTEYEQAILAFRKALKENPLSEYTHFLLGIAYEHRGKEGLPGDSTAWDTLAENEYKISIAIADYLPARFNLGMLLHRLDRPEEAKREWEHVLTINPGSPSGRRSQKALERTFQSDVTPQTLSITLPEAGD